MPDDIFELVTAGDVGAVVACIASDPGAMRARNSQGLSPIQTAFFMGRHAVVDALLAAEPELDAFEAAIVGDAGQLAARLDDDPGLLTAYSPDGWTLMHLAPWAGQPGTTRLLLERGADGGGRKRAAQPAIERGRAKRRDTDGLRSVAA